MKRALNPLAFPSLSKTQTVESRLDKFMERLRNQEGVVYKEDLNLHGREIAKELARRNRIIEGEEHYRLPGIPTTYRT